MKSEINISSYLEMPKYDKFCMYHFSMKIVSQNIKDEDKSPLFTKSSKLSGLSQTIYDLLASGTRGFLKKDYVVSALHDISVSIFNIVLKLCQY